MAAIEASSLKKLLTQLHAIENDGGNGTLHLPRGETLNVTHLSKIYFPKERYTKGDVMRYYASVARTILPLMKDRPLVLKRYPDGVGKPPFYQQNAPRDVPDGVRSALVPSSDGKSRRIIGGDLPTLLYAAQLGAIDVHPWLSRVGSLDAADFAVLDLDPTRQASFARVVKVARKILESLERGRYRAAIKTSGSRGIHIFVPMPPRTSYAQAQAFARGVATAVAEANAKDATIERSLAKRPRGTVYIDFLQNAEGKSVAAAFSLRARDGATVSMPISVSELTGTLRIDDFTIVNSAAQAARRGKQWAALTRYRRAASA